MVGKEYARDPHACRANQNLSRPVPVVNRSCSISPEVRAFGGSGMASGVIPLGDATLAARLVNTSCIRFSHPRLIVEFEQDPEPTIDQMIVFCLAALNTQDKLVGVCRRPS